MAHALVLTKSQTAENVGCQTKMKFAAYAGNIGEYATNGIAFDPTNGTDGDFATVDQVIIVPDTTVTYEFFYLPATKKIMGRNTSNGAEITNTTNLATVALRVIVIGLGADGT